MARARKATAKDVAELAGVSRSAVSMVLNGRADGMIAADKQHAVRAAAAELAYTPDSVARSLRSRRTHTVGVVTDHIATSAYAGQILVGATDEAMRAGYVLLVVDTQGDRERAAAAYATLHERQVDALMFAALSLEAYQPGEHTTASDRMRGEPGVLANCFDPEGQVPSVIADEVAGGAQAANLLIEAGHTHLTLLGGSRDKAATGRREQGVRQACAHAGVPLPHVIDTGWEIGDGYRAAVHELGRPHRPTGILCANDRVALGVLMAALRLGLEVPRDLSVIGYDDDENVAPAAIPALSTIRLPHREIGAVAMRSLLNRLADPADMVQDVTLVPCVPVTRASVAAPPA